MEKQISTQLDQGETSIQVDQFENLTQQIQQANLCGESMQCFTIQC